MCDSSGTNDPTAWGYEPHKRQSPPSTDCAVPDCGRPRSGRHRFCAGHERRMRLFANPMTHLPLGAARVRRTAQGSVEVRRSQRLDPCAVAECPHMAQTRHLCHAHYRRLRKWGDVRADLPIDLQPRRTLEERYWSKVDRSAGPDACWPWIGTCGAYGYGEFWDGTRGIRASWMAVLLDGRPRGVLCVLHTCDNPPCVNPAHLWLGTKADNTRDMLAKGRGRWQVAS